MEQAAQQPQRLWTKTFIFLTLMNFCNGISFFLLMTMLAEYSMKTFGVSEAAAALTVSVFIISALVARVGLGAQIDRWGIQKSLVIGLLVAFIACVLYVFPLGYAAMIAVRILHGIGFSLVSGASSSAAAVIIPASRYGEGIGYYTTSNALATGVGPFLAILLANSAGGYTAMFAASAISAGIALASMIFVHIPPVERKPVDPEEAPAKRFGLGSLIQLAIVPLSCVMLLTYICYGGVLSFAVPYANEIGLAGPAQFFFLAYSIAIVITRPPIGKVVDRRGENFMMYPVQIALVCGFVLLSSALNAPMLLIAAVLLGLGVGSSQSICQTILAKVTPKDELGRAMSTLLMFVDLGSGSSPLILGAFIPVIGYRACYGMLAVIAACAIVVYFFVHGRKAAKKAAK